MTLSDVWITEQRTQAHWDVTSLPCRAGMKKCKVLGGHELDDPETQETYRSVATGGWTLAKEWEVTAGRNLLGHWVKGHFDDSVEYLCVWAKAEWNLRMGGSCLIALWGWRRTCQGGQFAYHLESEAPVSEGGESCCGWLPGLYAGGSTSSVLFGADLSHSNWRLFEYENSVLWRIPHKCARLTKQNT